MSDRSSPQVIPLGRGRFEIVDGQRRQTAYAVRSGSDTWIFLDGRVHLIRPARTARRGAAATDDEAALSAPMPATVVAVNVAAGAHVAKGDLLVALEAMKMELAVRAPRDGIVRRVACAPGELVQPGTPLVELEPAHT